MGRVELLDDDTLAASRDDGPVDLTCSRLDIIAEEDANILAHYEAEFNNGLEDEQDVSLEGGLLVTHKDDHDMEIGSGDKESCLV